MRDSNLPYFYFLLVANIHESDNRISFFGDRGCLLDLSRLVAYLVASLDKQVRNQLFKTLESWNSEPKAKTTCFFKTKISPKILVPISLGLL